MRLFKRITALALVAVTAGALGMSAAAQTVVEIGVVEAASIESGAENIKSVYKTRYPEQTEMIDEIVDRLSADEEFIYIFEQEGMTAFQIIEDTLHDALDPIAVPAVWDGDECYYTDYSISPINQVETNFCGVASVIMALIGGGKMKNSDYTEDLLYEYAADLGVYDKINKKPLSDRGVHIDDMKTFLQKKFPLNGMNRTYKSKAFTRYSIDNIESYLAEALLCDTVPIIRVDEPRKLNYYPNNYSGAHYIIVRSVDFYLGEVYVIDPHYSNNYFGAHTITLDELKSLPSSSADLWMCTYTLKSDNPYIYN